MKESNYKKSVPYDKILDDDVKCIYLLELTVLLIIILLAILFISVQLCVSI